MVANKIKIRSSHIYYTEYKNKNSNIDQGNAHILFYFVFDYDKNMKKIINI